MSLLLLLLLFGCWFWFWIKSRGTSRSHRRSSTFRRGKKREEEDRRRTRWEKVIKEKLCDKSKKNECSHRIHGELITAVLIWVFHDKFVMSFVIGKKRECWAHQAPFHGRRRKFSRVVSKIVARSKTYSGWKALCYPARDENNSTRQMSRDSRDNVAKWTSH